MLKISLASLVLSAVALAAPSQDIVETAVANGSFKSLTAAVRSAGLVKALRGDGPFTVFAPTDAAFAQLSAKPDRAALQRILKFHVIPGRVTASALLSMNRAQTLNGQRLEFRLDGGRLQVNGGTVTTANLECSNGIIHVIDRVLMPEERTLVEIAASNKSFRTLVAAVEAADLTDALSGDGPFTVLAPTDAAFAKLPRGALANLLKPENKQKLIQILKYHVIAGRASAAEAIVLRNAKTLLGKEVNFEYSGGRLRVQGAHVVLADVFGRNGVIHAIDTVLLPPDAATERAAAIPALLELAIERGATLFNDGQVEACAAIYEVAAAGAIAAGSEHAPALREAMAVKSSARDRAWALRRVFDRILTTPAKPKKTAFQPIMEAPLPAGFPKPGPEGEIVVKRYPRYRMARAKGGMFSFGTLFQHIKKNKIEMTAPVEMTMEDEPRRGSMGQRDMAFLYASTKLGTTGQDGRVDVTDVKPLTVVSVGLRGPMNAAKLAEAKEKIALRLKDGDWKRAGDWRLLGYNSPMIRADRRYYEVQLPVQPNGRPD